MPANIHYAPVSGIQHDVLEKNGTLKSPLTISLEITNVCNQNCVFCVQSAQWKSGSIEGHHLSLEQIEALLNEARSLGVVEFLISGGEPTCHPLFAEIVERVKAFRFRTSIITNGVCLSSAELERLADILDPEQDLFIIGLDAADSANYKKLRGQNDFALVCNTLRMMQRAHVPFATQTVVVRKNAAALDDVWNIAKSCGSRAHILVLPYRIKSACEDIYLSDEEITMFLARLCKDSQCRSEAGTPLVLPINCGKDNSTAAHKVCSSGRTSCAVSAHGEIHICTYALDCSLSVGNINDISLSVAWKRIHQFIETAHGTNGLLQGHQCPVKPGLSQYDLTDA